MDETVFLTVKEVAKKLGISKFRVYRRIHRGDIPTVPSTFGNSQFLVRPEDLDAYMEARDTALTPPRSRTPDASDGMLSTGEVAARTGYTVETIRRMAYDGQLPFVRGGKTGTQLRIPAEAIDQFLKTPPVS